MVYNFNSILCAKMTFIRPNRIDKYVHFSPSLILSLCVDMQDFSQLSSKMVTEVLMLEIKMAPAAKAYLISGFPRSMRDVVEYSDKVHYANHIYIVYILPLQIYKFICMSKSHFHINYAWSISFIDSSC